MVMISLLLSSLCGGMLVSAAAIASRASTSKETSISGKPVFAHYLIGAMTADEAAADVKDAMAAGFDGFALNTHSATDSYATDAIGYLFDAASGTDFKLFFSCDVSWGGGGSSLGDFSSLVGKYATNSAHYAVDDRPFVSTFNGGSMSNDDWNNQFIQPLVNAGHTPYFVPDFDDWSGFPDGLFDAFPVMDGAFSWEDAWTAPGSGQTNVSASVAQSLSQQAKAAGKISMMPISIFQFKYMGSGQNWYRVGEDNLPTRMAQVLAIQPHLVEFLTWNDAGESHYIGNNWPEQIACCSNIQAYANGFDHTGWQKVVTPFIKAYKAGATDSSGIVPTTGQVEGAMWYRTLLTTASCSNTISNSGDAQDAINFAIVLASDASNHSIKVYSDGQLLQTVVANPGLNGGTVQGLQAGSASSQKVEVVDGSGNVVASVAGTKDVLAESNNDICNWNYEVVGVSA